MHRGKVQPISLFKPCIMSVRGPNNFGRAVQTDPTLLRYASAMTEQKKCWELLAEKFDWFQTLRNNTQQHPTTCNRVCKRTQHVTSNNVGSCWPTMLRPFARGIRRRKTTYVSVDGWMVYFMKYWVDYYDLNYDFSCNSLSDSIVNRYIGIMKNKYVSYWSQTLQQSQKLSFYCTIKDDYSPSPYLALTRKNPSRKVLVRFRISSHRLRIETLS